MLLSWKYSGSCRKFLTSHADADGVSSTEICLLFVVIHIENTCLVMVIDADGEIITEIYLLLYFFHPLPTLNSHCYLTTRY